MATTASCETPAFGQHLNGDERDKRPTTTEDGRPRHVRLSSSGQVVEPLYESLPGAFSSVAPHPFEQSSQAYRIDHSPAIP